VIKQSIICWLHGFKTKTGAEPWLVKQLIKENRRYPVGSQRNPSFDQMRHNK